MSLAAPPLPHHAAAAKNACNNDFLTLLIVRQRYLWTPFIDTVSVFSGVRWAHGRPAARWGHGREHVSSIGMSYSRCHL